MICAASSSCLVRFSSPPLTHLASFGCWLPAASAKICSFLLLPRGQAGPAAAHTLAAPSRSAWQRSNASLFAVAYLLSFFTAGISLVVPNNLFVQVVGSARVKTRSTTSDCRFLVYRLWCLCTEGDRNAYTESSKATIEANRQAIVALRRENKELGSRLRKLKNPPNRKHGAGVGHRQVELLDHRVSALSNACGTCRRWTACMQGVLSSCSSDQHQLLLASHVSQDLSLLRVQCTHGVPSQRACACNTHTPTCTDPIDVRCQPLACAGVTLVSQHQTLRLFAKVSNLIKKHNEIRGAVSVIEQRVLTEDQAVIDIVKQKDYLLLHEQGESEDAIRVRDLRNDHDKAIIHSREAEAIGNTYEKVCSNPSQHPLDTLESVVPQSTPSKGRLHIYPVCGVLLSLPLTLLLAALPVWPFSTDY